jgi:hypothetical protein
MFWINDSNSQQASIGCSVKSESNCLKDDSCNFEPVKFVGYFQLGSVSNLFDVRN